MLHDDGTFAFQEEFLEAIDAVVQAYERHINGDQSDLERELLITFVLGRMCCELDIIWQAMGTSPTLDGLGPRNIYEECVTENTDERKRQVASAAELLRERGWIAEPENKSAT